MQISELMKEAYSLRARIEADKARLAELNLKIAEQAVFPDGSKTGRLAMDGWTAKVQRRETVSWDQKALTKAVQAMGVEEFRKAWTFEYKPKSAKALTAWLSSPETRDEWRTLISEARQVKAGAPGVTVEYVGEEG